MKKLILLSLIVASHSIVAQQSQRKSKLIKEGNRYMVEYKGQKNRADESTIAVKLKEYKKMATDFKVKKKNKLGYYFLEVPKNKSLEAYSNELDNCDLFESVDYNSYGEFYSFTPNDNNINLQWHLSKLNMFDAWELETGLNSSVIVAILDSGFEWEHLDIGTGSDNYSNVFLNLGEDPWTDPNDPTSGNGIDDDGNGYIDDWKGWNYFNDTNDPRTNFDHATFVAGVVSAKTNNNELVAGLAGGNNGPGVKMMNFAIGEFSANAMNTANAIIDAVDQGAKVINLSFGLGQSNAFEASVQYAIDNGVIIIVASGNDGGSLVSYPAGLPNIIAVGASTSQDTRWGGSQYGSLLDIVAPGDGIYTTNGVMTNGGGASFKSKTSVAAPMATGILALMFSANPNLTREQAIEGLMLSAQKVGNYNYNTIKTYGGWNDEMGYGVINGYAAVYWAINGEIPWINPDPTCANSLEILGPNNVCTTGNSFSIRDLSNTTVTWTHSSNLTYVSGQGTSSYNVKANSNVSTGGEWIQATINSNCGSVTLPKKYVWVGRPLSIGGYFSGPPTANIGDLVTYTHTWPTTPNGGNYEWTLPYDVKFCEPNCWRVFTGGGTGFQMRAIAGSSSGFMQVRKTNACGSGGAKVIYVTVSGSGGGGIEFQAIVSPNPVDTPELEVSFISKETGEPVDLADFGYEVEYTIRNMQGNIKHQSKSKKKKKKINVHNLKKNKQYILTVKYGDKGHENIHVYIE